MYFFGRDFIALFNQEKDVIDAGRLMQLTFLPFYIVLPINQVINGVLRGAGRSAVPMYVMIFSFVFLRQIYLFLITKVTSDIVNALEDLGIQTIEFQRKNTIRTIR